MIEVRAADGAAGDAGVEVVTVRSDVLSVELLSLGAAIRDVQAPDPAGRPGPVHLRFGDVSEYLDRSRNPHLGASVGRYANRIAGATFPLDGRDVELVANNGANQLHGGPDGFDRRVWDVLDAQGSDDGGTVVLRLVSADGDQGFPGQVVATATYELSGDTLTITYAATTDAPTVVNLTNHGYWNLDPAADGTVPTVERHRLQLDAARYLPVDGAGIPTGGLVEVDGTPCDLRGGVELGPAMVAVGGGFDHCFEIDGPDLRSPVGTLRRAAVLSSPDSGRWMTVHTDQIGVQCYTGNGLHDPFPVHGSVSLETQQFPDTPNRPELGSARLDPGQGYASVTALRFGTGDAPT